MPPLISEGLDPVRRRVDFHSHKRLLPTWQNARMRLEPTCDVCGLTYDVPYPGQPHTDCLGPRPGLPEPDEVLQLEAEPFDRQAEYPRSQTLRVCDWLRSEYLAEEQQAPDWNSGTELIAAGDRAHAKANEWFAWALAFGRIWWLIARRRSA